MHSNAGEKHFGGKYLLDNKQPIRDDNDVAIWNGIDLLLKVMVCFFV